MLRYLRIKEDLNTRLEALVARGDYPDFNSLALTALENLVTAEEEFAAQGAAERSAPTATGSEAAPQRITVAFRTRKPVIPSQSERAAAHQLSRHSPGAY